MTAIEWRATAGLALVYLLRMFGLFLVVPVIALHAAQFPQATGLLVGMSVGIYGLTQALLQIPAGMLSDRIGRKTVIVLGLGVFVIGSLIAAEADSIAELIIGRAIQGCGAIAAAVNALLADQVRSEFRSRSMAVLGISIGFAFMLAIILGPSFLIFSSYEGLFLIAAFGAVIACLALFFVVPAEQKTRRTEPAKLTGNARRKVVFLGAGVFLLHLVLTGMFVQIPQLMAQWWPAEQQGLKLYLPAMILSIVLVFPLLGKVEKTGRTASGMLIAMTISATALFASAWMVNQLWGLYFSVCLFFLGFNFLEASLPSAVSKVAPAECRGAAMGIFSSMQFAGVFVGGVVAGSLGELGPAWALLVLGLLALLWLPFAYSLAAPGEAAPVSAATQG